ncbi:hypothetical protein LCGC14_1745720, partial [marine sediment metagenome]
MRIAVRLKKILVDYKLDNHGVLREISDYLDVHRHTVGKLYRNQANSLSFKALGKLC